MPRTVQRIQQRDGINVDFGNVKNTPEQRRRARLTVVDAFADNLGEAREFLDMLDLLKDED